MNEEIKVIDPEVDDVKEMIERYAEVNHEMLASKGSVITDPPKVDTVLSTVKKDHRIWVERNRETGQVSGFMSTNSRKVGTRPPIKRMMLGIGDEDFAKVVAKDFKKKAIRSISRRYRNRGQEAR